MISWIPIVKKKNKNTIKEESEKLDVFGLENGFQK